MSKLHFGCFNNPKKGWINTDVTPHIFIARVPGMARLLKAMGKMDDHRFGEHQAGIFKRVKYLNVTRRWPYANGSLDAVFSSHVLEHLPLRGATTCMREAFRCLRPGGVLRIAVPDLNLMIEKFDSDRATTWATELFEADQVSEKNMHHFMYNFTSMSELMRACGFGQVQRCDYREGRCPDIDTLDNRPDSSLFVEAVKD